MTAFQPTLFGPPEWVVFCDGLRCESIVSDTLSRESVQAKAKAAGWLIEGEDLCPRCVEERR